MLTSRVGMAKSKFKALQDGELQLMSRRINRCGV